MGDDGVKQYLIENISTGGGCEHILIQYPTFGLCVLINNENQKVPRSGESYDIGVYKLEQEGWMGEYIDNCFETFDNFDRATIAERTWGYLEGKGFENKPYVPLIDRVIEQIKKDFYIDDVTAIEELLKCVPKDKLVGYLSEES
jgi:hypothetical protein